MTVSLLAHQSDCYRRAGVELHKGIAQRMGRVSRYLAQMARDPKWKAAKRQKIFAAKALLEECQLEMRRTSERLYPPLGEFPFFE